MKYFILFLVFISLIIIMLNSLFELTQLSGKAMSPAIQNQDVLVFAKYPRYNSYPPHGTIVLYRRPSDLHNMIGRVVATPGERIRSKNGQIYIKYKDSSQTYMVEEKYLSKNTYTDLMLLGNLEKDSDGVMWYLLDNSEFLILPDARPYPINTKELTIDKKYIKGYLLKKL